MRTIEEIRHINLLRQSTQFATIQAFADQLERSHSQVTQVLRRMPHSTTGKPREVDGKLARHIEHRLNLPRGWMDQDHDAWPLPLIDKARWDALDDDGQRYVQSVMALAIEQLSSTQGPATPSAPSQSALPAASYSVHEPEKPYRKRTGTRG